MTQLGLCLSDSDVQAMMKSVDVGPQGKITFPGITVHMNIYFCLAVPCLVSLHPHTRLFLQPLPWSSYHFVRCCSVILLYSRSCSFLQVLCLSSTAVSGAWPQHGICGDNKV